MTDILVYRSRDAASEARANRYQANIERAVAEAAAERDPPPTLAETARAAGIRSSGVRPVVIQVLDDAAAAGERLRAEDIIERANGIAPGSCRYQNVIRALRVLRLAGLITRNFRAPCGPTYYVARPEAEIDAEIEACTGSAL